MKKSVWVFTLAFTFVQSAFATSSQELSPTIPGEQPLAVVLRQDGNPVCISSARKSNLPYGMPAPRLADRLDLTEAGLPLCSDEQVKTLESLAQKAATNEKARTASLGAAVVGYAIVCTAAFAMTASSMTERLSEKQLDLTTAGGLFHKLGFVLGRMLPRNRFGEYVGAGAVLMTFTVCAPMALAEAGVVVGLDFVVASLKKEPAQN